MKKAVVIFISFLFCAFTFTVASSAANTRDVYTVAESDGAYVLSKYDGGTPGTLLVGSLSDIISALGEAPEGSEVLFSSVNSSESIEFPSSSLVLKGSLNLNSGASVYVPAGTSLTLDGFNTVFSEGSCGAFRIKGGEVIMRDSCIFGASGGAVLLDYAPTSVLVIESGSVTSDSETAAIRVESGSLAVLGGHIDNTSGIGVKCDSALYLSGSPVISGVGCDIETEKPLTLAYSKNPYLGGALLDVRFLAEFKEGTMTEVFYSATESSVSRINLTDKNGASYALSCFSDSVHTDEKNFAAVYLPYTVKLFDGAESVTEYKLLSGDCLSEPTPIQKIGYSFSGWYLDEQGREKYSFDTPVTENLNLYSRYSLNAPSFKISSLEIIYDGKEHTLSFTELSHPLDDNVGAFYSYEWYRDGNLVSRASALQFTSVSASGVYECTVSFSCGSDTVSVSAKNINLTVNKAEVKPPEIASEYYTGSPLSPDIYPSSYYTAAEVSATDAGVYPVMLTLADPENFKWSQSDEKSIDVAFVILPANNFWSEKISVFDVYYGAEITPSAVPAFGEAYYVYSYSESGEYSRAAPQGIGRYFVKALVDAQSNYTSLESEALSFEIRADGVSSLEILTQPSDTSYCAFEHLSASGLSLRATYNSGKEEIVGIDKISISYQRGDSFRYGDSAAILSYGGVSISLPVSIARADYDISSIILSDFSVIYDGKYHTASIALPTIFGQDGLPLEMTLSGGGTDVGFYTVSISFSTDSRNYNIPKTLGATLEIIPATAVIVWDNTTFTYDGTAKQPTAYYIDVFGVVRYPAVIGAATDAGENYTAAVSLLSENYSFENLSTLYKIKKADYDLSKVCWNSVSFVYDGQEKSVSLTGLPEGVTVIGYTDGFATEAGNYTATAALSYDTKNYNPPGVLSHSWCINPAEYDLSSMNFSSVECVFDGNIHYPTAEGVMPIGADGIALEYSFSGGAVHVSEGKVAVRVIFKTESKNYITPADILVYVTIIPKGITVNWKVESYTYDGSEHAPVASASESTITVMGAQKNAGTHTATAVSDNTDYCVINATQEFTVAKALNKWTILPQISDIYTGGTLLPKGESLSGTAIFYYYATPDCVEKIETPTGAGCYYMIAECPESTNYLALISQPVSFTITELAPVSMGAELLVSYKKAFEALLPTDFICFLINNDGSKTPLDSSLVSVIYTSADSLRKSDTDITFRAEGFEITLPIIVHYADYDLSGVRWENTESVYDGIAKYPVLTGLPAGVSVVRYTGEAGVNAGSYTAGAVLSYDSENYNPPVIPDCSFTIARCELPNPTLDTLIYNGSLLLPTVDISMYKIISAIEARDAGEYKLTLSLADPSNYCFAGGVSEFEAAFTVLPMTLCLNVEDLKIYLWEEAGSAEYALIGGSLAEGDTLEVIQRIEDGKVYLSSADPNYVFSVRAADIVELPYPSPSVMRIILIWGLVILLVLLLLAVIFTQRVRIASAVATLRYRLVATKHVQLPEDTPIEPKESNKAEIFEPNAEAKEELSKEKYEEYGLPELDGHVGIGMDIEHADELITDSLAKDLVKRTREVIYTYGSSREIINVDTLSDNFSAGERVDVNILKKKSLIPYDTAYIKVLARGMIDKPLSVYANDFSLSAVKMIALTGGEAVKVITVKEKIKDGEENRKNY